MLPAEILGVFATSVKRIVTHLKKSYCCSINKSLRVSISSICIDKILTIPQLWGSYSRLLFGGVLVLVFTDWTSSVFHWWIPPLAQLADIISTLYILFCVRSVFPFLSSQYKLHLSCSHVLQVKTSLEPLQRDFFKNIFGFSGQSAAYQFTMFVDQVLFLVLFLTLITLFPLFPLYSHNERKVTCKHPVSSLPSQDNCIFVVNEQ